MALYGYARVSTQSQKLEEQIDILLNEGITKENIYSEKFTGTKSDRPKFNELMALLEEGDTLIITKLDRLARNTKEALEVIDKLLNSNVSINVLNLGKIENTSIGKMIYTILLSVAELERDMIVERTQSGKEYAKKNNPNYKEGRPRRRLTPQYLHAVELLETNTYKEVAKITGISTATLIRIKRQYKEEQEAKIIM